MTITLSDVRDRDGVLSPVTLDLPAGTYGVVGPNAAGKTTLLELLHRAGLPDSAFARASADATFAGYTVADHLACAQDAREHFNQDLFHAVLGDVDPTTGLQKLSVGQRRRLTLASAIAAGTGALLLDEPFDGLDAATRAHLREHLIDALTGSVRILVLTSHRAEDLAGLVDQIIAVHDHSVTGPVTLDETRTVFPTLEGPTGSVAAAVTGRTVLSHERLGGHARATVHGSAPADAADLEVRYPTDAELIDLLATHAPTRS